MPTSNSILSTLPIVSWRFDASAHESWTYTSEIGFSTSVGSSRPEFRVQQLDERSDRVALTAAQGAGDTDHYE